MGIKIFKIPNPFQRPVAIPLKSNIINILVFRPFQLQQKEKTNSGYNPGGGDTPYNGLYGEAPPERGTFFRLQVYKRVGILQVEVYKRVAKSVI